MAPRPVMFAVNAGAPAPAPAPPPAPAPAPPPGPPPVPPPPADTLVRQTSAAVTALQAQKDAEDRQRLRDGQERERVQRELEARLATACPECEPGGRGPRCAAHSAPPPLEQEIEDRVEVKAEVPLAPPPAYKEPERTRRDLFDVHVPAGSGPGTPVIASGFKIFVPPFNRLGVPMQPGESFRVEFVPHDVSVPSGAMPGSTVLTWVHQTTAHVGFEGSWVVPAGFVAGQSLKIMVPARVTEGNYCLCCGKLGNSGGGGGGGSGGALQFFHVAPNGYRAAYSPADNAIIAQAHASGAQKVRVGYLT